MSSSGQHPEPSSRFVCRPGVQRRAIPDGSARQCRAQSHRSIEIIVVDDGSTDSGQRTSRRAIRVVCVTAGNPTRGHPRRAISEFVKHAAPASRSLMLTIAGIRISSSCSSTSCMNARAPVESLDTPRCSARQAARRVPEVDRLMFRFRPTSPAPAARDARNIRSRRAIRHLVESCRRHGVVPACAHARGRHRTPSGTYCLLAPARRQHERGPPWRKLR